MSTETAGLEPPPRPGDLVIRRVGLVLGPVLAFGLQLLPTPAGLTPEGWWVVSIMAWMVVWWASEAVPVPLTGLLPLIMLPMTDAVSQRAAAAPYASPIIFLLLGGFIIARAIERWNLHRRIALNVVVRAGANPGMLIAGFMVAAAGLSMWISNTATILMLTPIAVTVARSIVGDGYDHPFTIGLLLCLAYSASVGGLATPVGTPTNLIVIGFLQQAGEASIGFVDWMQLGLPVVLVMLPLIWWVIVRWTYRPGEVSVDAARVAVRHALTELGPMTGPERRVLAVFALVAGAWILRQPLSSLPGLGGLSDMIIAIAGVFIMMIVPAGPEGRGARTLLTWHDAEQIPWGMVLLFGGGLSLASALTATGLADWLGTQLQGVAALPLLLKMLVLAVLVIFATEMVSNVATASALMPIVLAIAASSSADAVLMAAPVAMAASCAFMLPIATGPNAVVFATGQIRLLQMAKAGLRLNLLAAPVIACVVFIVAPLVFG